MKTALFTFVIIALFAVACFADPAAEIMKKSSLVSHYAGNDSKARMALLVYHQAVKKPVKKIFILLRKDIDEGGTQKYFLYFTYPREIKRASFLVFKHTDEDDYRRLFLPASNTVLMISGQQKQCAFMGSDFSAEDITGRHYLKDRHQLLKEEVITLKSDKTQKRFSTYVIESIPIVRENKTSKTVSWIDKQTYLPVHVEFYNHENQLYKVYQVVEIKTIDGYPTIVKQRMTSPLEDTHTLLIMDQKNTQYDLGVSDDVFVETSLYAPPGIVLN